ncbi:protein arginine N-methyltransferase 3-like [Haemaphysalis longicornis]
MIQAVLSTAIEAEPTHWKQTVFLQEEPHVPVQGESTLRGRLECRHQGKLELELTITSGTRQQKYALH